MASTIIDLDQILGDDKRVKLGSKVYVLPPDLPVELYLKIQRRAQNPDVNELDLVEEMYDEVLDLFRYKQPTLKELPLSLAQVVLAIGHIYGGGVSEGDAGPPPVTRGGASSKTRSRAASRSPKSPRR